MPSHEIWPESFTFLTADRPCLPFRSGFLFYCALASKIMCVLFIFNCDTFGIFLLLDLIINCAKKALNVLDLPERTKISRNVDAREKLQNANPHSYTLTRRSGHTEEAARRSLIFQNQVIVNAKEPR